MKLNFPLEIWVALGSFGLSIMFVLLISSFYLFLVGPDKSGPDRFVDIQGVLMKTVSISGAPSIILAGIVYALSRNYGSEIGGILISISGVLLIVGMFVSLSISSNIPSEFFENLIIYIPYIFVIAGIGIFIIGFLIYIKSKKGVRSDKFN